MLIKKSGCVHHVPVHVASSLTFGQVLAFLPPFPRLHYVQYVLHLQFHTQSTSYHTTTAHTVFLLMGRSGMATTRNPR